jgi:hypothetical protein
MLNKYAAESKRKDLGYISVHTECRTDGVHKFFIYRIDQSLSKLVYTVIVLYRLNLLDYSLQRKFPFFFLGLLNMNLLESFLLI